MIVKSPTYNILKLPPMDYYGNIESEVSVAFENPYLVDFTPIFFSIIKEKGINPAKVELIIFDEEADEYRPFERADVLDVLNQLCNSINALTIYTDRPEIFSEFVEQIYEESGLLTTIAPKKAQKKVVQHQSQGMTGVILDFEWRGTCYQSGRGDCTGYIPIHKKPWEMRENLDILVPFGYNTVIVKGKHTNDKRFVRDRFDEGFYRDE